MNGSDSSPGKVTIGSGGFLPNAAWLPAPMAWEWSRATTDDVMSGSNATVVQCVLEVEKRR